MITLIAMWMMFKKAGVPGWAAIVPFYNMYILFKITTGKGIKFLWLFVPIYGMIILSCALAEVFSQKKNFAIGIFFLTPIFIWILGFGKAVYKKPVITQLEAENKTEKDEISI